MKKIYFVVIPAIVVLVIFLNMLYGHNLIASATEDVANKYEVYIHLQPEWNKDQKNILFEVTNYWSKVSNDKNSFEKNTDNHNYNKLQYIGDKSYVELKHDFSNCQEEWQPMLYRKAIDTIRHEIEFFQGNQLSPDPETPVYPDIENESYDKDEQQLMVKDGFSQFIPICTSKDQTSYDYSIKTDSNSIGFDVYFVTSVDEQKDFHESMDNFDFYTSDSCFAQNKKSYSGFCGNVNKNSGLLIVIPDALDKPLTKVFVTLKEKKN